MLAELRTNVGGRFWMRHSGRGGEWGSFTIDWPTGRKMLGDAVVCPEQLSANAGPSDKHFSWLVFGLSPQHMEPHHSYRAAVASARALAAANPGAKFYLTAPARLFVAGAPVVEEISLA